jgi:hypothetical protein
MPNLPISQLPLATSGQPQSWMAIVNYDVDPSGTTNKIYFSALTEQFSGSTGTSGTSGTSGTDGSSGTSGSSGTDGSSGTSGTDGSSGTSGTDGSSGTSGSNGTDGSSGTSGTDGSSGTSGTDGSSGTSGTDGSSGTSGTNGSSGTSGTSGLVASNYVAKGVKNGTPQTIPNETDTIVTFIDDFDPQGWITSNKFQPNIEGYYTIQVAVWWNPATSGATGQNNIQLRKNGTTQVAIQQSPLIPNDGYGQEIDIIVFFNGTTDYVEVTAYSSNPTSQNINGAGTGTWITASLIVGGGGTDGSSGTSGTSGSSGTDGTSGTSGSSGTNGTSGSSGTNGTSGSSGTNGTSGTSGISGLSGTTGSWTVTPGTNNYSFTVAINNTYNLWVLGNIPSGIIVYNATVSVTNNNVPVIGVQYAWNYTGAGSPILLTSIPAQIIGTAGAISTDSPAVGTTTNTFVFGIQNTTGSNVTVNYGYLKIS